MSYPHTCIACPIIKILHQSGMFVVTDEPTLTYHYQPKSTIYIMADSCVVHFMGLDKCIMSLFHHYGIKQSTFFLGPFSFFFFWYIFLIIIQVQLIYNVSSSFVEQQSDPITHIPLCCTVGSQCPSIPDITHSIFYKNCKILNFILIIS